MSSANPSAGFARPGILLLLCPILLPAIAWCAATLMPRGYTSTAIIEPAPGHSGSSFGQEIPNKLYDDPGYIPNQIERIQSSDVLSPIAAQFQLGDKLPHMIRLARVSNGLMLQLAITSDDPKKSADIANAIAAQYRKINGDDLAHWINAQVVSTTAEVEKRRKQVQAAANDVSKTPAPQNSTAAMQGSDGANALADAGTKLDDTKKQIDDLKASLDKINNAAPADMKDYASEFDPQDAVVTKTIPAYTQALADEAELVKAGTGDDDSSLKNVRDEKADLENTFNDARGARVDALREQIATAQQLLDTQQKAFDDAKQNSGGSKAAPEETASPKDKYIEARRLLDESQANLENEKLQLKINHPIATVWQTAEPAQSPSSPDTKRILLAAFGAGILCALYGLFKRSQAVKV